MFIQCTKKLLEQFHVEPISEEMAEPLFSWHANLMIVNRRKTVVLVNDQTRYSIVLHGLKAKEFKNFQAIVIQGIREVFQQEGIKEEIIKKYLDHSLNLTLGKTKDRTSVARMNKVCENVYFFEDLINDNSIFNTNLSVRINKLLAGNGKNSYIYPNEEMYQALEAFAGESIFSIHALQMKMKLILDGENVWRRVIVPVNRNFNELHEIIQIAFGWENNHLYEFYIYEKGITNIHKYHSAYFQEGYKPIVNLVCIEDDLTSSSNYKKISSEERKLSDYLLTYKIMKYNYDFGDNWQHEIQVEKEINDFNQPHPICLDGEGKTPPEDVGGMIGYREFLEIVSNPNHPDYNNTVKWGQAQGYHDFNKIHVNAFLKNL